MALFYPEWDRPCALCEKYDYDKDGEIKRDGKGNPLPRAPGVPTPCQSCAKVPKWAKERGLEWRELRRLAEDMTDENRRAFRHYRECKAVHQFPDDPLVRWVAGIIADIETAHELEPVERNTAAVQHLITLLSIRFRR